MSLEFIDLGLNIWRFNDSFVLFQSSGTFFVGIDRSSLQIDRQIDFLSASVYDGNSCYIWQFQAKFCERKKNDLEYLFQARQKVKAWNILVQFHHPSGNEGSCHRTSLNPSRVKVLYSIYVGFKFIFLVPFHHEFCDSFKLIFALLWAVHLIKLPQLKNKCQKIERKERRNKNSNKNKKKKKRWRKKQNKRLTKTELLWNLETRTAYRIKYLLPIDN